MLHYSMRERERGERERERERAREKDGLAGGRQCRDIWKVLVIWKLHVGIVIENS